MNYLLYTGGPRNKSGEAVPFGIGCLSQNFKNQKSNIRDLIFSPFAGQAQIKTSKGILIYKSQKTNNKLQLNPKAQFPIFKMRWRVTGLALDYWRLEFIWDLGSLLSGKKY